LFGFPLDEYLCKLVASAYHFYELISKTVFSKIN